MNEQYTVVLVRGIGTGAGMFAVSCDGVRIGKYHYSRDEAEAVARRLNAAARAEVKP